VARGWDAFSPSLLAKFASARWWRDRPRPALCPARSVPMPGCSGPPIFRDSRPRNPAMPKPTEPAAPSATPAAPALTFEACLARLEALVAELERADLPLEQSVQRFEEGMKLVEDCRAQLDAAEGKVEMLVRRAGAVS